MKVHGPRDVMPFHMLPPFLISAFSSFGRLVARLAENFQDLRDRSSKRFRSFKGAHGRKCSAT